MTHGSEPLPPVPARLADTRVSLHRLAAYVIAPARYRSTGRFGLRWTPGGFGTPEFDHRRIRVDGARIVDEQGDEVRSTPITTLAAAADFLDAEIDPDTAGEHDSPPVGDPDEVLAVDPDAVAFLDTWFGMAFAALEAVRNDPTIVDPSEPQLWPGHFDPAIEAGDENHRASYGASPGDDGIPEPYLYVALWWPDRVRTDTSAPIWNAPGFNGRVLRASAFDNREPVTLATEFWRSTHELLR